MGKKILMITIPIIIMIIMIFSFGIAMNKNSYKTFPRDGYVISVDKSEKYYFTEENKFKIQSSSGKVMMEDNNEQNISLPDESFVHYVDGSISTFKKAVVLNLDEISGTTYQYYNFFPGTVFAKGSKEYRIEYLDKSLDMKNFLLKISDDKYMVVGENITVFFGEEKKNISDGFLEIAYLDGNIIRLDNQELSLQNISPELRIDLNNNATIDLINKKIKYKENEIIDLGEITIDSDDNIDIVINEEDQFADYGDDENNSKKGTGNDGNSSSTSNGQKINQMPTISNGMIEVDTDVIEEIIEDNAAIKDASYTVSQMRVTSNGISAEIQISDPESTLVGENIIKIIRNDTNEIVYYYQDSSGRMSISLDIENLKPEMNYTLIVNSNYVKNEMTYNKDFIQKTFVTSSLGIEVLKSFSKVDGLGFDVIKKSYSDVTGFNYTLYNEQDEVVTENYTDIGGESIHLEFDELASDTNYRFVLSNFKHENIIVTDGESITGEYKTLKRRPIIGKSSFSVDKQNSKFILYLNNIQDLDNGVKTYHAEVYEGNELILTKSSKTNSKIEIPIDDNLLERNTNYRVYVYLVFNDNEKAYEIPIGSEYMNLNSKKKGPVITFDPGTITWERIEGTVFITDDDETIDLSQDVIVTYQNLSIGTGVVIEKPHHLQRTAEEGLVLPLKNINNLRANDSYLFTIKAYVNYQDGNEGYVLADIGQFIVQTGNPNNMSVDFDDITDSAGVFNVRAKIKPSLDEADTAFEASTMSEITFRLYSENYDETKECTSKNGCWEKVFYDGNEAIYESTLKSTYYDANFTINTNLMDINEDDITYGMYTIKIFNAKDYTDYRNELPIINNTYTVSASTTSSSIINKTSPIEIKEIENNETISSLKNDTIIGYELTPNILPGDSILEKITFHVYNALTSEEIYTTTKIPSNNSDTSIELFFEEIENFERGGSYYFKCEIKHSNAATPEMSNESKIVNPMKQEPEMEVYLSSRVDSTITWKYICKDVDSAIADGKIHYWLGNNEANTIDVEISTTNPQELKTFDTTDVARGSITIFHYVKLNVTSDTIRTQDARVQIESLVTTIDNSDFNITNNVNIATINLNFENDTQASRIMQADVRLNAGRATAELTSLPVVNRKINIAYNDIRQLKGKGTIDVEVTLYYDTGIYGPDNVSNDNNRALQLSIGGYKSYEEDTIFSINNFNYFNRTFDITKNTTTTMNFLPNKGYLKIDDDDVQIKVINNMTPTCTQNCTFEFNAITPSLELTEDNINSLLRVVRIHPTITSVDETSMDNMNVIVTTQKKIDGVCDSSTTVNNIVPISTLMSEGYAIEDLEMESTYCLSFMWTETNSPNVENVFYYPINKTYENVFEIQTKETVGIHDISANYMTSDGTNQGRYMKFTYDVDITEGYDGIIYEILTSTDEPVVNLVVDSDSIESIRRQSGKITKIVDIHYLLQSDVEYKIRIKPYYLDEDQITKIDLETKSSSFYFTISDPKITMIRRNQISNDILGFRMLFTDSYNATFERNTFDVYLRDLEIPIENYDTEYGNFITSKSVDSKKNTFENLTCQSGSCVVSIVYQSDTENTGNYVTKVYSKEFYLDEDVIIDSALPVSSNDSSSILIAFADYSNLNAITSVQYTIISKEGEVVKNNKISPVEFILSEEDLNYAYLRINENLGTGGYNIMMVFSWPSKDGLSTEYKQISIEYIKN